MTHDTWQPVPASTAALLIGTPAVIWIAVLVIAAATGHFAAALCWLLGPAVIAISAMATYAACAWLAGDRIHHIRDAHPMDDIDHATDHTQRAIDARLAARQQYSGTSATHCDDCEDPIPEKRRALIAGCRRCPSCQDDAEKRARP